MYTGVKPAVMALSALSLLATAGCGSSNDDEFKRIEFEKFFENGDIDNLSSKFEIVEMFQPEFSDSTMFADNPVLLSVEDGKAYMYEDSWMSVFEYPSGKIIDAFNHLGGGPGEYSKYAWVKGYDVKNRQWYVLDNSFGNSGKIMTYDYDGNYLDTVINDSIQTITPTPDGGWLAFNNAMIFNSEGIKKIREIEIFQYTDDWKPVKTYTLNKRRWGVVGTDRMNRFILSDGKIYTEDRDTVYKIDTDGLKLIPEFAFNTGKYGYDWGSIETWEELKSVQSSHVIIDAPVFNSRYCFVSYDLPAADREDTYLRFDIYDLDSGDLVYRHTRDISHIKSLCPFFEGIPLEIDGETVYAWPTGYVVDDMFYALIGADEMAKISDTDLINPIFVKLRIK